MDPMGLLFHHLPLLGYIILSYYQNMSKTWIKLQSSISNEPVLSQKKQPKNCSLMLVVNQDSKTTNIFCFLGDEHYRLYKQLVLTSLESTCCLCWDWHHHVVLKFGDRQLMTTFLCSGLLPDDTHGPDEKTGTDQRQSNAGAAGRGVCWWCRVVTHVSCCSMAIWWEVPWYKPCVVQVRWLLRVMLLMFRPNLFMWHGEMRCIHTTSPKRVYHRMLVCLVRPQDNTFLWFLNIEDP